MLPYDWRLAKAAQDRREKEILEAVRPRAPRRAPLFGRVAAAFGERLVVWGCRLQARFGARTVAIPELPRDQFVPPANASPCS